MCGRCSPAGINRSAPTMRLADPWALLLLALVPVSLSIRWPRRSRAPRAYLTVPRLDLLPGTRASGRARWAPLPVALRAAAIAFLVMALARPQSAGDAR